MGGLAVGTTACGGWEEAGAGARCSPMPGQAQRGGLCLAAHGGVADQPSCIVPYAAQHIGRHPCPSRQLWAELEGHSKCIIDHWDGYEVGQQRDFRERRLTDSCPDLTEINPADGG